MLTFHPRCGELVAVLGEKQHAGTAHLVIRQPDRTLSLLPKWMTEPIASCGEVLPRPRLSVQRLANHPGLSLFLEAEAFLPEPIKLVRFLRFSLLKLSIFLVSCPAHF